MNNWTREEEIVVFELYCRTPFKNSSKNHPEVIKVANIIGRTPSAVNMKIGNFGSFDENLKKQGIVGLTNASKLDGEIWEEFNDRWDKLSVEAATIVAKMTTKTASATLDTQEDKDIPVGRETISAVKRRINQSFFRSAVLASYNGECCITGIATPELLIASHIKPWKDCNEVERTNPRNGLCLNALHDMAFDKGYITVKPDGEILVSNQIKAINEESKHKYFLCYDKQKIRFPDKFLPDKEFLEYHNDVIFEKWKRQGQ